MASDIFLKLDGIRGEADHVQHQGEIEVLSWSWSLSQPHGGNMGGSTSARAAFHDLVLVKAVDRATPALWHRCASGTHITKALLTVRDDTVGSQPILRVALGDVRIVSVALTGDTAGERPSETVHLGFGLVEVSYTPMSPSGAPETAEVFSWDVRTNKGKLAGP